MPTCLPSSHTLPWWHRHPTFTQAWQEVWGTWVLSTSLSITPHISTQSRVSVTQPVRTIGCFRKPSNLCVLFLQSLQNLTPNTDAPPLSTEMTGLTKHTSACRRSWKTVREVEGEGRSRTALHLHHRSPAAAPQQWTFTTELEWRCWRPSRDTSATRRSGARSRPAEAETEKWEVKDVYNWTATQHFTDWCLYTRSE